MSVEPAPKPQLSGVVRAALRVAGSVCGDEELAAGVPDELWQRALLGPAADFLERPGRAFRAKLVGIAWELAGRPAESMPEDLPTVVELIHAGSLIVDDIEDGSDVRRGEPALHRIHGTAVALNTGNWMYFAPLALLGELGLDAATELELRRLANRAMLRCHHGQALDLTARIDRLDQDAVPGVAAAITQLKTAALTELAASLGAVAGGAGPKVVEAVARFGRGLGAALQMLDDLGGVASAERLHKGREDLIHRRVTWPWRWAAQDLAPERYVGLTRLTGRADVADDLAGRLASYTERRGRAEVDATLGAATGELQQALLPSPALARLAVHVARLRRSYG